MVWFGLLLFSSIFAVLVEMAVARRQAWLVLPAVLSLLVGVAVAVYNKF